MVLPGDGTQSVPPTHQASALREVLEILGPRGQLQDAAQPLVCAAHQLVEDVVGALAWQLVHLNQHRTNAEG